MSLNTLFIYLKKNDFFFICVLLHLGLVLQQQQKKLSSQK
jgi:hypothetical protein